MQDAFSKVTMVLEDANEKIQQAFVDARRQQVHELAKHEFTIGQLMLEKTQLTDRIGALESSLAKTMKALDTMRENAAMEQKMCENILASSRSVLFAAAPAGSSSRHNFQEPLPQRSEQRASTQILNPEDHEQSTTISDILYEDEDYHD